MNAWLAEPFDTEVSNYRVMWYWHSTTADEESHLRSFVANAHPIWHARWKLAKWLTRIDPLAWLYLAWMLVVIAGEVAYNWIVRAVRCSDG